MIDPDVRRAVKSDSITTPNVLRIKISNFEVLNDHVVGASGDSEAFAQDDTILADTENGLVARHHEGVRGCLVVGNFGLWCGLGTERHLLSLLKEIDLVLPNHQRQV